MRPLRGSTCPGPALSSGPILQKPLSSDGSWLPGVGGHSQDSGYRYNKMYECTVIQKDAEEYGNEYSAVSQQVGVGGLMWEGTQEEANWKSNVERMEK